MRLFIAITIPPEKSSKIVEIIEILKKKFPSVRWENPEKVHLTLVFLGYVDSEGVRNLRKVLYDFASNTTSINLTIGNLSYFYKKKQDSIISLELEDKLHTLRKLYKNLKIKLEKADFSPPERLYPHLTLGRVKRTRFPHEVKRTLGKILKTEIPSLGEFEVNSISLFESTYSKNNNTSQYRLIESFPLLSR